MSKVTLDFGKFIETMKNDPSKRETALKYEKSHGPQEGLTARDQPFYKDYLGRLKIPFFVVAPKAAREYDMGLLLRLIFGSLSSDYAFSLDQDWADDPKGTPIARVSIYVSMDEEEASAMLDELTSPQLQRLLNTYLNEQVELSLLRDEEHEDDELLEDYEDLEDSLDSQFDNLFESFKSKVQTLLQEADQIANLKKMIPNL